MGAPHGLSLSEGGGVICCTVARPDLDKIVHIHKISLALISAQFASAVLCCFCLF